jgi:putative ABC transport system permease protein
MRRLRAWAVRIAGLFSARRRARQFDAELESHVGMHVDEYIRRGIAPDEARRRALAAAGGLQVAREAYRDRGGLPLLETTFQDIRFAVRMLRKAPGFTAAAVLVLALGIGANGAMFSLINALLLRPVVPGARELVGLYSGSSARPDAFRPFSYPEYLDIRERNDVFDALVAESFLRSGVTGNGVTTRVAAALVSSNYFSALGLNVAAGRAFTAGEERPGSAAVAIVSHDYWRVRGLSPDVIGRIVVVNGRPLTIVGVAPEGFRGTMPVLATDFWLPLGAGDVAAGEGGAFTSGVANDRAMPTLLLAGTLKDGVSIEEAQSRLVPIAAALAVAYPQHNRDQRLIVHTRSRVARGPRPRSDAEPLTGASVLMAIAGLVMLVACLNLANMMLARGSVRQQEIAVRLALGGGRMRIVRQLLVEGLLLSAIGSLAALAVGWWAADRLVDTLRNVAPMTVYIDVSPDARVVAAIVVACVISTLMFALGPAWKLSRPDLVSSLKLGMPIGAACTRRASLPGMLVGTQVALSLALLIAAGAFVRAGANAATQEPGFPLAGGLLASVDARLAGFDEAQGRAAYAAVFEGLRAMPGVRAASAASIVPLGGSRDARLVRHDTATAEPTFTVVGADYFAALGLRVLSGREFSFREEYGPPAEPVAIVDQALAARLFGAENALGQLVQILAFDQSAPVSARIVGIVPQVRDDIVGGQNMHVYVPFAQHYRAEMTIHVRTAPGGEAAMLEPVRERIRSASDRLPILSVTTLTTHRDSALTLWAILFAARSFGAFGAIALVLATAGVYGLRAYLVTQRTREMGIRLALGATRSRIVSQLLREGTGVAGIGMLAGLALALGLIQILRQSEMLYEVDTFDPVILVGASLLLVGAVAAASYIPARRAVRVDPAVALRPE